MSQLRVLGIGSPFGDDQLGWDVVKLLQQRSVLEPFIPKELQLMCCDRPGMYLLELMRDAKCVFLIDAVKTGAAVGTLHCFQNEEISALNSKLSTHAIGLADAITMGAILQELPEKITLYGIEVGDIHCQFSLSETIAQAINLLSEQLENDILQWLH